MDWTKAVEWIGRATATSLLAGIVVTGYLGLWVYGTTYTKVEGERDEYKQLVLRSLKAADSMLVPSGPPSSGVSSRGDADQTGAETVDGVRRAVERLEHLSGVN